MDNKEVGQGINERLYIIGINEYGSQLKPTQILVLIYCVTTTS